MARREFPTVLELVGNTPIVRLARLGRDVPGELLAKLEYLNPGGSVKGPHRPRDGRGGRAGRPPASGRDDRRADLGEHRRRTRDRRGAPRLPLHLRHAGQDEPGEDLDAARVRRRGRDHADRRRSALAGELLRGLGSARRGDPRRLQARPVLESPRTPRRTTRRPAPSSGSRPTAATSTPSSSPSGRAGRSPESAATSRSTARRPGSSPSTPRARSSPRTRSTPPAPISSRESARSAGPTRSTRPWSTSGCACPIATRSSRRGDSRARRVCSSAAPLARRRGRASRSRRSSGLTRAS